MNKVLTTPTALTPQDSVRYTIRSTAGIESRVLQAQVKYLVAFSHAYLVAGRGRALLRPRR